MAEAGGEDSTGLECGISALGPSARWFSSSVPVVPGDGFADLPPPPDASRNWEASQIDVSSLKMMEKVGSGGTAEVYRGTYKGGIVAVKQLLMIKKMDIKEQISFQREVNVLANIVHPNLVKFFGVTFQERPFKIITEFCEGGTCFDQIHNSSGFSLSWPQKFRMSADTVRGMDYLHREGIIHRDLKSLNLLLDRIINDIFATPCVKVADFGFSRMKEPGTKWGKMTSQVGTLHWMAPEVFSGSSYDEKCDVYSFAMVMYEILFEFVPFEDEDPGQIGEMACRGVRPDLTDLPPGLPLHLQGVMVDCWARDASRRPTFGQALEMLDELENSGDFPQACLHLRL